MTSHQRAKSQDVRGQDLLAQADGQMINTEACGADHLFIGRKHQSVQDVQESHREVRTELKQ